ncbi:U3 snoRNP protein [Hypoxylon texense]
MNQQAKRALVAEIRSRLVDDVSDDFRNPMKYEYPRAPQGRFSIGSNEILPLIRVANGEGSFQGARYLPSRQGKSPPPSLRRWGENLDRIGTSVVGRPTRRKHQAPSVASDSTTTVLQTGGPGYLKKQRRLTRREEEVSTPDQGVAPHDGTGPHTADEDSFRSLLAPSEIRRDVRSSNSARQGQFSETEQSARFRSDMERVALKRSKTTDAFVRVPV